MNDSPSFEQAYTRLEQILERMNGPTLSLEDSLKLYEEADRLISFCNKRLGEAESRIEQLIKNREGDLVLTAEGHPQTQPFPSTSPGA